MRRKALDRRAADQRRGAPANPSRGACVASTPTTIEQRCATLCAAHPSGFVTGPTAGILAGLRRMPQTAPLHFAVRHGHHHHHLTEGFTSARRPCSDASHRLVRRDGIVVASPARLAFDLAADLRPLDHLSVLQQLLHERKVTVDELVRIERRLGHPPRPGSGLFRRNLERLDGTAPNESHDEVVLAEALRARGVPVENQSHARANIQRPNGTRRPRSASVRWGVELDIHPEHRTFEGQASGACRVRDLHLMEWQIEPVTEHDMQNVLRIAGPTYRVSIAPVAGSIECLVRGPSLSKTLD